MEEDIEQVKEFIHKTAIYYIGMPSALKTILNELERQQKDNVALEYQLSKLHTENSNISRELIHRTDELNKLLEENQRHKKAITVEVKVDDIKEFADKLIKEVKEDYIPKQVIREYKNKFIEDSKNEKVFMTQSSQINASLISFCKELLGDE